jgi:hypothetical protein
MLTSHRCYDHGLSDHEGCAYSTRAMLIKDSHLPLAMSLSLPPLTNSTHSPMAIDTNLSRGRDLTATMLSAHPLSTPPLTPPPPHPLPPHSAACITLRCRLSVTCAAGRRWVANLTVLADVAVLLRVPPPSERRSCGADRVRLTSSPQLCLSLPRPASILGLRLGCLATLTTRSSLSVPSPPTTSLLSPPPLSALTPSDALTPTFLFHSLRCLITSPMYIFTA